MQRWMPTLLLAAAALAVAVLLPAGADPWPPIRPAASRPADCGGRDAVLLLDRSGSMAGEGRWQAVRDAVRTATGGLGPDDRLGVVLLGDEAEVARPLSRVAAPSRVAALLDAVEPGGGTGLEDGLDAAFDLLDGARACRDPRVVLVTDGALGDPQDGGPRRRVARAAREGVTLHAVGLGADEDLLASLAEAGRGTWHAADDAADLTDALASLLDPLS